jgi:ABC-2 type transport system permease protein
MRALKAYPALLRAYWERAVTYRAVFVIALLNAAFPLVMMAIWIGMAQDGPVAGYTAADFASYYLSAILVRRATGVGIMQDAERMVRTGELSVYLIRPLGVFHHFFARVLASRPLAAAVPAMLVASAALLIPGQQFDLRLLNLLLFGLACGVGLVFEFLMQYLVAGLSFWIVQTQGVSAAYQFVRAFLGGYIVPLALFPPALGAILIWLPFQVSVALPVELLTGRLDLAQGALRLGAGIAWTALAGLGAQIVWSAGLRSYTAVGA